jgi:hypothetical protein
LSKVTMTSGWLVSRVPAIATRLAPPPNAEARLLFFFGPAGVEGFFRDAGKPARSLGLPPADEQFVDRQTLIEIASRYATDIVGPPLPPKD